MWQTFLEALRAQLGNQVVVATVALGLIGVAAAALRKLPGALWSQAQRLIIVTATLDSRNELFEAFMAWLDEQRIGRRSRWFMVVQSKAAVAEDDAETPPLQTSPALGWHFFIYRGRLMWLHRDISMNLQVIETVRLSALLATRETMDGLLAAYFSPSWTAFQADRGRRFSGIVDDGGGAQVIS